MLECYLLTILTTSSSSINGLAITKKAAKSSIRFGILTDIQYAPIADGKSIEGYPRFYNHSLTAVEFAARKFQSEGVDLVLNLGDIIDGQCTHPGKRCLPPPKTNSKTKSKSKNNNNYNNNNEEEEGDTSDGPGEAAVSQILNVLSNYQRGPIFHIYGNHDLYNLGRGGIAHWLNVPMIQEEEKNENDVCVPMIQEEEKNENDEDDLVGYRSYLHKSSNVRFILLDTYDITVVGRPLDSNKGQQADHLLRRHNAHNYPQNPFLPPPPPKNIQSLNHKDHYDQDQDEEQEDIYNRRWVALNGGLGSKQIQWLQSTLSCARRANERVIISSHQPIHPHTCDALCLVWNYEQVLSILTDYSDIIMACFSGHWHSGGYHRDVQTGGDHGGDVGGIHYGVLEAILETPPPHVSFAIVDVFNDNKQLVIRGSGRCSDAIYECNHLSSTN